MLDQTKIKDIRFSVDRIFWADRDFYGGLEERVFGTFTQWLNAAQLKPRILWDDEGVDTTITMHDLLAPDTESVPVYMS